VPPPTPLDALPSDPLLSHDHEGRHSSAIPGNQPSLQQHRSERNGKTHGSTGGQVNCAGNTPSTLNAGHHDRVGHRRAAAFPPLATPCPGSNPPSTGINCVENTPAENTPAVSITPPISRDRHNATRHGRKQVPLPPTTTATTTVTTTTPCPGSDPGISTAGSDPSDNSNGFTDVIVIADPLVPHHPHRRPHQAPEPGTLTLLALGFGSLWLGRRLSKKR